MDDPVQCNREKCDDIEKKRITWAKKEEEMTECVVMTSKEKEEQVRTALMRREGKGNKLSREKRKEISTRGKKWKMLRSHDAQSDDNAKTEDDENDGNPKRE